MSEYSRQVEALCAWAIGNPGTGGARAIGKIVNDLEGDGPIAELLHTLDRGMFDRVIALLVEFRNTGKHTPYNSIHARARASLDPGAESE